MSKILPLLSLVLCVACAHDDGSNAHESLRGLGRDITALAESTNTPNSASDPTSVRYRVHQQVIPLRERLEKIRQRTNNNVAADAASNRDPTAEQADERAKIQAELDRLEAQLNAIDKPEEPPPAPTE